MRCDGVHLPCESQGALGCTVSRTVFNACYILSQNLKTSNPCMKKKK